MKITIKKILSVALAVVMTFACFSTAFAAGANYVVYNNTVSAFEGLKYNKGYQELCIPEYVDFIDAVLAENALPDNLEASEQALINQAVANIEAAKAELLTDKFKKAEKTDINDALAKIDLIFASLGALTPEQQAEVDALKVLVSEYKADKDNVSIEELNEVIAKLEAIENYVDGANKADYAAYDFAVAAFELLKDNLAYRELCVPEYADYIDAVLAEVALPGDLTVKDQHLINEAINKIAEARAVIISDEYMRASAADIEAALKEVEDFIAGLEDLTAEELAKVNGIQDKVDEVKADMESVSRKDVADILVALENLKYELDDTRPADYTRYDIEVRTFSDLRYNRGYLENCIPEFIDYIDAVLAEVALPRDLTVKDQYLIDEAIEKLLAARAVLISDEYMKASKDEIDGLIAEIEKVLGDISDEIKNEIKNEIDAIEEKLEELKNNSDSISKEELADIIDALEELKELIKELEKLENDKPADYTDYNYWYPQVTARAQHPYYYGFYIEEYAQIVEEFIAEVTIPTDLKANQQYIIDAAVEKLLDFDEKLKNGYFLKDNAEDNVEDNAVEVTAEEECDCKCHKSGIISQLVYDIIKAIRNLFGMSACCACA